MGIASSLVGFLRFLIGFSVLVGVALASFFGLPRFRSTCSAGIMSTPSVVAVVLFFGLHRFFGALPEATVSVSFDGVDADASAAPDAAAVLLCFLCRFAGSGAVR